RVGRRTPPSPPASTDAPRPGDGMRSTLALGCVIGLCVACATAPRSAPDATPTYLDLAFTPETDAFRTAAKEDDSLWASNGARIARALETAAHLRFADIGDTVIRAVVYEGVSMSGFREKPMQLRASYPVATKKATLMHELGHRLESNLF